MSDIFSWVKRMFAAKVLVAVILIGVYLAGCLLLLADSFPPLWVLFFIALHILYSRSVVWLYAYLKVRKGGWAILLIPALTTTSTIGIAVWLLFQPEERIRRQYRR
ncbi:MAG: hypothetical protein HC879_22185 [Leptolyngbyaceae cyanobacterium SL_5_9]|nr:hypothetical protein [Leptolyngbyaceae cyanobacterium SL_5_9]